MDSKAELLELSSPYVYALNSPTNFLDKDGELPIFINGLTSSDSERGDVSYWDQQLLRTIENSGIPNPGGEKLFIDGNQFVNKGSGWIQWGTVGAYGGNQPEMRREAGTVEAKNDFDHILSLLEKDSKSGKITEKIQIYAHSRGVAYAAGFTEELIQLIKDNADKFADPQNEIDFLLNLAPNQSGQITDPSGVDAYSAHHNGDLFSGNNMDGVKAAFSSSESSGWKPVFAQHTIKSFTKDVEGFLNAWKKDKGDSDKLIRDFVIGMQKKGVQVTVHN